MGGQRSPPCAPPFPGAEARRHRGRVQTAVSNGFDAVTVTVPSDLVARYAVMECRYLPSTVPLEEFPPLAVHLLLLLTRGRPEEFPCELNLASILPLALLPQRFFSRHLVVLPQHLRCLLRQTEGSKAENVGTCCRRSTCERHIASASLRQRQSLLSRTVHRAQQQARQHSRQHARLRWRRVVLCYQGMLDACSTSACG